MQIGPATARWLHSTIEEELSKAQLDLRLSPAAPTAWIRKQRALIKMLRAALREVELELKRGTGEAD